MEGILCPNHSDSYCLLKTGTKAGPSQGISFYVCAKCKFIKQTSLLPTTCSVHSEKIVELQSFIYSKKHDGLRQYFRCNGRVEGESWCGFQQLSQEKADSVRRAPGWSGAGSKTITGTSHDKKDDKSGLEELNSQDRNEHKASDKESKTKTSLSKDKTCDSCEDAEARDIDHLYVGKAENKSTEPSKSRHKFHSQEKNEIKYKDSDKESETKPGLSKDKTDVKDTNDLNARKADKKSPPSDEKKGTSSSVSQTHYDGYRGAQSGESQKPKPHEKEKSSLSSLTFSDISKSSSYSAFAPENSFQDKSFQQYRNSPAPTARPGKSAARKSTDSGHSDSEDSDVEVKGTKDLLQRLSLGDEKQAVDGEDSKCKKSSPTSNEGKANVLFSHNATHSEKEAGGRDDSKEIICLDDNDNNNNNNSQDIAQEVLFRSLKEERAQASMELEKFKSSARAVHLGSLPDKGRKIHEKITSLKETIVSLDSQMVAILKERGGRGFKTVPREPHKPSNSSHHDKHSTQAPVVREVESNHGAGDEAKGHQNNSQYVQLPSSLSHLFDANPQAMTLYSGRMTAQRLREVGSITSEAIEKLHKQLDSCPSETTEVADPKGLVVTLMPHQRQALAWLEWREQQQPPGGILADDMGLGKTLTMISHLMRKKAQHEDEGNQREGWLRKEKHTETSVMKKSRATLIVAPASLVHQWAKEVERRCRRRALKVLVYHGPNRETNIHRLSDNDVVLTTYAIVSKEIGASGYAEMAVKDDDLEQDDQTIKELPLLLRIGWERIILDEAHDIKNHKSARSQSVCRLKAAFRWALTGTPIQNDMKDMYSLLRFLRFSPFDEWKVWKKHIESASVKMKRVNIIVKSLLLRRTKDQSTQDGERLVVLPPKTYKTFLVDLSAEERKIYDKVFQQTRTTVRAYVHRHSDQAVPVMPGSQLHAGVGSSSHQSSAAVAGGAGGGGGRDTQPESNKTTGSKILVFLLRLRQCCSHLNLMKGHLEQESAEADSIELSLQQQMQGLVLGEEADQEGAELGLATPSADLPLSSPLFDRSTLSTKLSHVIGIIKKLQEEKPADKSVIVSQWTSMLEIVSHHLDQLGIHYSLIQGNVPSKKRADLVDDFNRTDGGAKVMLVSLCAGGVGLNLVGGNNLFLLDSHWNPALEEQACDRIYRIGQKKDVTIYRFICKNTIEEKILTLQKGKLSLAQSVLSGMGTKNQKLSLHDLRMLFGV